MQRGSRRRRHDPHVDLLCYLVGGTGTGIGIGTGIPPGAAPGAGLGNGGKLRDG